MPTVVLSDEELAALHDAIACGAFAQRFDTLTALMRLNRSHTTLANHTEREMEALRTAAAAILATRN